jgi:tetrachlorobenzoquinone reductase
MADEESQVRQNHIFTVVLASSGASYEVPVDKTILQVLREHGHAVDYMCERGGCGRCAVPVLEGDPDHRDSVLTQRARDKNRMMTICISRSLGDRLVLDK